MRFLRILGAPFLALSRAWNRSITFRITAMMLLLSVLVMTVLGISLLNRVTSGLLDAQQRAALSEASIGLADAQRLVAAAGTGSATLSPNQIVDTLLSSLATQSGSQGQFEVLLLSADAASGAPERGTNQVSVESVPNSLRATMRGTERQAWTYTTIRYLDGSSEPGFIVGSPLAIASIGSYQLCYLFPLAQVQQTLDVVRSAVIGTGLVLIGVLIFIAWLVTRQVVHPVRRAAATAREFSAGNLAERMPVRHDDDLGQLAASFNDMAASISEQIRQLETLSQVQQRFVSDVSHELRTPLSTIRMAADVMFEERSQFDPSTARAAELLQTQIDRFEVLLSDLLEISRFDAGVAVLDNETIDLRALVTKVVEGSIPLADRLGTSVRIFAATHDYRVDADYRRIERILRNLLDNAIEHSETQGVDVLMAVNDTAVAVVVRDYGSGLRPGEASLVFNRFWRTDPARARTTGGTGLGLAIALEDARLHRGWLEAWGQPGKGASFRLTLPRRAKGTIVESPLPLDPDESDHGPLLLDSKTVHLSMVAGKAPRTVVIETGKSR